MSYEFGIHWLVFHRYVSNRAYRVIEKEKYNVKELAIHNKANVVDS
jgi:hypothetical protein